MRLLDEQYTRTPLYGVLKMTAWLCESGHPVNCKRVRRLLRLMGLEAIYPKPRLSLASPGHQIYPYLLRGVKVARVNQVWSADITYVRLLGGFVYLVAIIDWYSRYVLSWEVSTTMESEFCVSALNRSLQVAKPEIFNTDQGSQFTSNTFTGILKEREIAISMDGRGRALDNIFVERLWRSVKYEDVYIRDYETAPQAITGLGRYFKFYYSSSQYSFVLCPLKYELVLRRIRYRPTPVVGLRSRHQLFGRCRLEVTTTKNPRPIG